MTTTAVERVPGSYAALREQARAVLEEGRTEARAAVEEVRVETYWKLGKLVNEHLRLHDGRAGYGDYVANHLSEDLGMSRRLVYEILNFQRVFPIVHARAQLPWTHLRLLSRVESVEERERLFRQALHKKLSARELLQRMGPQKLRLPQEPIKQKPQELPPLLPVRGNFYTYQIVKPRDLHLGPRPRGRGLRSTRRRRRVHLGPEFYSVDLGFGTRIDLKLRGLARAREGEVIEALRTQKNPAGDRYRFRRSKAGSGALYTYKATVEKVIDDDTLWTQVDAGFHVWTHHKLRLRGINAPEVHDQRKMSRFVEETLARVAFVVVKLHGRDKFDRALADLFYKEGEPDTEKVLREGTYLNQELLDRGLAVRYEGD